VALVAAVLFAPGASRFAGAVEEPGSNTVSAWGSAPDLGPSDAKPFDAPVVGIARAGRAGSNGYWLAAADGGVFSFGDAGFFGAAARLRLAAPIVGIAATPKGDGYWLAAAGGGVFAFGGATFHGSMGAVSLQQPIVGIASTPSGGGYWLVAADGGVFAFGDAPFHGSLGHVSLNAPIVGLAPYPGGAGYWLVASDGGIFAFGDAPFYGSLGGEPLPAPVVDIAASPDGMGYWLAGKNGQVYPFGVTDEGSPADDDAIEGPTVGMAAHSADGYWFAIGERPILQVEDSGPDVRQIQQRLADLGYWLGAVDSVFGELTEQAVYAFQKVEGLPLTGEVTPDVRAALQTAGRPQARGTSDLVEVDKSRQVLLVVRGGTVMHAFNTSTGTEDPYTYEGTTYLADTPNGRWQFFWQVDGYRTSNLGRLYRPKYFHEDGIAVHGYSFVPPYPASHGCVRVTNPAINFIWAENLAPLHTPVWVYGTSPERS
jgi:hypothetical protein